MNNTIKIIVQRSHPTIAGKYIEVLRSSFEIDSSCQYDYNGLLRGIRLLFPNYTNLIINITVL